MKHHFTKIPNLEIMQSSSSSSLLSLKEPLLVVAKAVDERSSELDQTYHRDSSARLSLDKDENKGPQKHFHANKNELGCSSCIHRYISKLLPLLLIMQHVTTLVILVPFLVFQFGFVEEEANATMYILPPRLVIGLSLTLFLMLIWLYIHEKAPTQEFLLRILHPAILVEINVAIMLILDKKEEIAIATLLISMVGVGAFVLFGIQDSSSSSSDNEVEGKIGDLLTV